MENNENRIRIKQIIWLDNTRDAIGLTYGDAPEGDGKVKINKAYLLRGLADHRDMFNGPINENQDINVNAAIEEIQESNLDNPDVSGLVGDVLDYMTSNPTIPATMLDNEPIDPVTDMFVKDEVPEEIQEPLGQIFNASTTGIHSIGKPDDIVEPEE